MPEEAEALGLLALIRMRKRAAARVAMQTAITFRSRSRTRRAGTRH